MKDDARVNPARIDALIARVQRDIDAGIQFGGIQAAGLAIGWRNTLLVEQSFGKAGADSTFLMFSITKTLLDSALWILFDEGLSPDTAIDTLLPHFMGGAAPEITIRMVQTHLGGFAWQPLEFPDCLDRARRLEAFARWRPETPPGARYEYHPLNGAWVLAEVIQQVSGLDYREFVRRRVIEPLGLGHRFKLGLGCSAEQAPDILLPIDCARGWTADRSRRRVASGLDTLEGASAGIPGVGGLSTAGGVAMLYQAFLRNPAALWKSSTLDDACHRVRVEADDPMGRPMRRTASFLQAGPRQERYGERMFFGQGVSERAFGHQGQGGQVAWADPETGLSFCFLTDTITFPPGGCFHPRAPELSALAAQVLL